MGARPHPSQAQRAHAARMRSRRLDYWPPRSRNDCPFSTPCETKQLPSVLRTRRFARLWRAGHNARSEMKRPYLLSPATSEAGKRRIALPSDRSRALICSQFMFVTSRRVTASASPPPSKSASTAIEASFQELVEQALDALTEIDTLLAVTLTETKRQLSAASH
jgi:hypothetical protein